VPASLASRTRIPFALPCAESRSRPGDLTRFGKISSWFCVFFRVSLCDESEWNCLSMMRSRPREVATGEVIYSALSKKSRIIMNF
jgi:hypothetical protein